MPLPKFEPVGAVAYPSGIPAVEFRISGLDLSCITCGDGGLVIATHNGWVISCRNGHNYHPTSGVMIIISPESAS